MRDNIPTIKEIRALEKEAWKLYDAEKINHAEETYLETVANTLAWVLGDGDDPLKDSRE